tara:strand:+ start:20189 stop:20551 length:363 start_codon:yes stop_codon:yes gene_type:complete
MDQEHSISGAKQYDPEGLEGTQLNNAPDLGQAFDQGSGKDGLGPPEGMGSQQVKDSGAQHDMKPTPEIANDSDREAHQAGMAKDDQAAQLAHLEMLMNRVQDRQQSQSHTQQHGQGHGLS